MPKLRFFQRFEKSEIEIAATATPENQAADGKREKMGKTKTKITKTRTGRRRGRIMTDKSKKSPKKRRGST